MDTLTSQASIWSTEAPSTHVFDHNLSAGDSDVNMSTGPHEEKIGPSVSRILLPAMMFLLGVFGNVLALVILHIRPSKDSRSTAFYHLVKCLAVVDLTGILALSPVPLATNGQLVKVGGMALCHYFSFAIMLAGNATQFVVLVMAVERFMVTKFPFQYPILVTRRNINITIVSLWLLSAFLAALPIMGFSRNTERWPGTWCFMDYRDDKIDAYVFSICYASVGLLIIIVTFILNMSVIHHLWRMRKTRLVQSSIRSQRPSKWTIKGPDSETRMVLFLLAIIASFTFCYCPLMIRVLINQFQNVGGVEPGGMDDGLDLWAVRVASINQIIDPWIYIISRFTCCRGNHNRGNREEVSRSPNRTTMTTAGSNSPSPKRNFIHSRIDQARALFNRPRKEDTARDNAMVPLSDEFPKQVSASYHVQSKLDSHGDFEFDQQKESRGGQEKTDNSSAALCQSGN